MSLHPPDSSNGSLMRPFLSILAIVLLTLALRGPLLDIPFERDEGEYAYIAWRLGHDELPYRDWFDQKPPAIFWVYRLASTLPCDPVRAVHIMGMLFSLGSAIGLYFFARRLLGNSWGLVAALLFAALSADPLIQGTAANTELFMLLPLILSHLLFLAARDGRGGKPVLLLIGVASGLAMAFKQVAFVNWVFLAAAYPLSIPGDRRWRRGLDFALWSATGVMLVWGLIALYFNAHQAMGDFVYNVFTHNFKYINAMSLSDRLRFLLKTLGTLARTEAIVWILAPIGLVATFLSGRRWLSCYCAGWLATGLVGVCASGYFFPHYFQQILPPLALLAILGLEALARSRFLAGVPPLARKSACAIALALLPCCTFYPFIFRYTPQEAVTRIYPEAFFAQMPEIGRLLARLTRPDERIFIFGAEPELFFYARRASATEYIFLFPLYGPYGDALERQKKAAAEITAAKPAAVLFLSSNLFFMPGTEQYFTQWTRAFLEQNYYEYLLLARDKSGEVRLIDATLDERPAGHTIYGALLLKKKSAVD